MKRIGHFRISPAALKRALTPAPRVPAPPPLPLPGFTPEVVRDTLRAAAAAHGVTVEDLRGAGREQRIAYARQDAMARLRGLDVYGRRPSLAQVGRWLNRDHSTVLHGIRAHEARETAR